VGKSTPNGRLSERRCASGAEYDNPQESSRRLAFQDFWAGSRVFEQDAVFRQSRQQYTYLVEEGGSGEQS
jgi:hypothetical protein